MIRIGLLEHLKGHVEPRKVKGDPTYLRAIGQIANKYIGGMGNVSKSKICMQ